MVGAGPDDQAAGTAAFQLLETIVAERLRRGLTTVVDTLGLDADNRARWVTLAHDSGIPAHAIVFDTAPAMCQERNETRDRPIPRTVLRRQLSSFNKTRDMLEEEDFDGVHVEQPIALVAPAIAAADVPIAAAAAPPRHTFGLMISRFDWEHDLGPMLVSIAKRAEEAGFRDIWVMDHFRQIRGVGRPWEDIPEAYAALGLIAGVTSTIRLGALVTGITHRYPVVLGKTIATLDVLSSGRAICGLGIAWDKDEHLSYGIEFPAVGARYEMLEETLQMLPLLWGKGSPEFHGKHIDAGELVCYPRPVQAAIPILIGGGGEKKTLRLVARYADACNLFGDPGRIRHKVDVLNRHCAEVDRDPSTIEVTHLSNALVAPDRSALRDRIAALRDRNVTPERYMKEFNAGTPDDLEALFTRYAEAGAGHSIVALPDVALEGSIETFSDVIARFTSP
jgi:F420-dependent oxidoreductase-like protein